MPPLQTINLLRALFVIFAALIGGLVGDEMLGSQWEGALVGTLIGLVVVLADRLLKGFTLRLFSSATFGLLLGLFFAQLLLASDALHYLSQAQRWLIGLVVYGICGYLGMMLAVRSNRDDFALIIPFVRFEQTAVHETPVIVDTNVIIEGHLEEVCASGFLTSSLIVPRFILDELQLLADSADAQRRERGRRGLDNLTDMQHNARMIVTIHEAPLEAKTAIDTRLVNLARVLGAKLLTNDGNLTKIARLQQVQVLNLVELSRAVKANVDAGDSMELLLVKEGREPHQAVGYLPDGSMIVVNNAKQHLGSKTMVKVSSSVPTAAGRIFFAELAAS